MKHRDTEDTEFFESHLRALCASVFQALKRG